MNTIYEPNGKAREYSPLALNLLRGCDHGCFYCYVPGIFRFDKKYKHSNVEIKKEILKNLLKCAENWKSEKKQVLLSFTTDPYTIFNNTIKLTRSAVEILINNEFPVSILTKGGFRLIQDLDIFIKNKNNVKIGTTLVYDNNEDSLKYEPGAASTSERIETIKLLYKNRIKTWVSFEPVIKAEQTINLLKMTIDYVDHYKIGKLNHFKTDINYKKFLYDIVKICRDNNIKFYIKRDLAIYDSDNILNEYEKDQDHLNIKWVNNG